MNVNSVKPALYLFLLCSIFSEAQGQAQRHVEISGRAVDNKGDPVQNVTATLDTFPCRGCPNDVVPSNRAIDDAVFFVDTTVLPHQYLVLYLAEIEPVGFWSPVGGSPYSKLRHLPEFRGIRIRPPRKSSRVDLGNVEVKIRFGKVILMVPDDWRDLATESTSLVLRLRDRTGALIYDNELPLSTANAKSDSVKLALTPGRWKVQLLLRQNDQKFSSSVKNVVVRVGSCTTVPLTKLKITQPCSE